MADCGTCSAELRPGAKFCDQCGAATRLACVACAAELRPGARFCDDCGASQQDVAPRSALVERKVTSVLFGDLVGFTTLSEQRDKEEVRELLSAYFSQCRRIASRYGGTIEKFIGDAVMTVWGVPSAHEDDAERAVRAGLELVRAVETLGEELGLPGLAMRVGIVTGEVAVTIGAEHEGMVAGDAVNTAARVQTAAEPGQVWVDENTRLLTSGAITYVDMGTHVLKGKADPVPLWAVRAVVAAIGGAQRADGLEAPLIGRARELRVIKELFHGVEETGRPALVVVNGEPGLGKSRLGWEFEKYIDGLATQVAWHSTRCLAYGDGVAFSAIAEAVRGRLGLLESDPDSDPEAALDAFLGRFVPDETEASWVRPRVLALVGSGASGFERDDLFAAWRTFFERTREHDSVVALLIDDAQHADEGTVFFLEYLLANSTEPLFVMLLSRPDLLQRRPELATNRRATILQLSTLDGHEMAALLDGLVNGLPVAVRDGLVERAEGVPLYAMETVRSLIDRDLVVPRGGVYLVPDPEAIDLTAIAAPASLQALVAARLDGLPPVERRVVADACVLGMTFTREALQALSPDLADLDAALAALTRAEIFGLISSRLSAEYGQYRFLQAVVRQVAYGSQARRDRKGRHLAVAAYFEAIPDTGGDYAPVLAQHFLDAIESSGQSDEDLPAIREKAVTHLARSAARARTLGSIPDAVRYLETAIGLADDDATAPLHLEAARAAFDGAVIEDALRHGHAAMQGYTGAEDAIGQGNAAAVLAMTQAVLQGDNAGAIELAAPYWEALQGVAGAETTLLHLGRAITVAQQRLGEPDAEILITRIAMAEALGDRTELADALISVGAAYAAVGPTLSTILYQAGAEIARSEQRPRLAARALLNLGALATSRDLAESAGLFEEASGEFRRAGGGGFMATVNDANLLLAELARGNWDRTEKLLAALPETADTRFLVRYADGFLALARGRERRVPPLAPELRATDDGNAAAWLVADDALTARVRGDLRTAAALAGESAERIVRFSGWYDETTFIWPASVEMALIADDTATVDRLLGMLDAATPGRVGIAFRAHRHRFAGLLGTSQDTERELREAIAGFEEWGSPIFAARTRAELARWLVAQGREADAGPLRQAAAEVLAEAGAHGWLAELGLATVEPVPVPAAGA